MMKTWKQFMAGMCTVVLVAAMAGTALAAGGRLQVGAAGVVVKDQVKVEPGGTYTVGKERIPGVVDYEAANGKSYHYLPVQMFSDYLNIRTGWSEQRGSVVLGSTMEGAEIQARVTTDEETLKERPKNPTLGLSVGAFTEVSPSLVDTTKKPTQVVDDKTRAQSITGYGSSGTFLPENGRYILLTITNNGTSQVRCQAGLPITLGIWDRFPSVALEPGNTLTRAFVIAEGTTRESAEFVYGVSPTLSYLSAPDGADVTITFMQYR